MAHGASYARFRAAFESAPEARAPPRSLRQTVSDNRLAEQRTAQAVRIQLERARAALNTGSTAQERAMRASYRRRPAQPRRNAGLEAESSAYAASRAQFWADDAVGSDDAESSPTAPAASGSPKKAAKPADAQVSETSGTYADVRARYWSEDDEDAPRVPAAARRDAARPGVAARDAAQRRRDAADERLRSALPALAPPPDAVLAAGALADAAFTTGSLAGSAPLTYDAIPWPCGDGFALVGCTASDGAESKRSAVRRHLLFWHSDKFTAAHRRRIVDGGDAERVFKKLNEVTRHLSDLKARTSAPARRNSM
ncbi:hypothetical protein M885DRAFT_568020 [Pelagophyceae sp. CCMP2097]|nr:hypothetical protein M885DRAFT_568020 [Pelagophyceae sp. CCMP2097]